MSRRGAWQIAAFVFYLVLLVVFRYRALHKARPHTEETFHQAPTTGRQSLTVAFIPVTCHLTCPVTDYASKTSTTGTEFDAMRFGEFPSIVEALKTKKLLAGFLTVPLAMKMREQGAPIKICTLGHRDGSQLTIRKEDPAKSLRDMRGKTIAIPSPFSNENFFMHKMMRDQGIRPDEIKFVVLPPPDMPAALSAKAIDGFIVAEPYCGKAEMDGYGRVLYYAKDVWPNYISCCLVVHEDLIREKPEIVRDLVRGIVASGEWVQRNRDGAAHLVAPYFGQNEKLMNYVLTQPADRVSFNNLKPTDVEIMKIMDMGISLGFLKTRTPPSELLDRSFFGDDIEPAKIDLSRMAEFARHEMTSRETRIAALLCFLAALRVFLFGAAFPFFNNVDEQSHFDLVYKYAHGHVPGSLERRDPDAARTIVLYATPEYFLKPGQYPEGLPPRFLWPPSDEARRELERLTAESKEKVNFESTQPPVYYAVAGAWYRLWESLGLRGGGALYSLRFLNVLACAGLTALAYLFARTCFPDSAFLRLGVPFLVAFFPQDAFYAVNNDTLLPLVGGAAFFFLLLLHRGGPRSLAFHAGTGFLIAAAILVKFSSIALVPVAAVLVTLGVLRIESPKARAAAAGRAAVLFAAAAVPLGAWCARNYALLGDLTGSMAKARYLHWTLKPVASMFDHPILSLSGLSFFWRETLVTFWRGEFVWGLKGIASAGWDRFYGVSSLVLVVVAMIAPLTFRKDTRNRQREVLWPSLALFLLSLAFLATVSAMFDFDDCIYPSRAVPYMTSGRLALGALLPFVALYLSGLDALLPRRLPDTIRWAALIVPVALMTLSEFRMSSAVFKSAYNWFHLP